MQKVADSSAGRKPGLRKEKVADSKISAYVWMGPNGHREKDNCHSYSLWINSYGTSLNGRFFFSNWKVTFIH